MQNRFYKKAALLLSAIFVITSGLLCGCQLFCEHEWVDATCLAPKTCSLCALTEGEPAAHQWLDADCTNPKTCAVCTITEGDPLEHTWTEATCTTAKTCSACSATDGDPLGHSPSEPVVVTDYVEATQTTTVSCTVCHEIVDTSAVLITKMHDYTLLSLDGPGIAERFNKILKEISPDCPYGLEYQYYQQEDDDTGEIYYTDQLFQKYNDKVYIFDPYKYTSSKEQDDKFNVAKEKIGDFTTHTNGPYSWYGYTQYFGAYLTNGEYPGISFKVEDNAYAKDIMIAALITFFPELTPESAWGVFQEARSGDQPNMPGPYVRNGLGIKTIAQNTQTNSNDDFENCNYFTLLIFTIAEDSPYNVEHETAYPILSP